MLKMMKIAALRIFRKRMIILSAAEPRVFKNGDSDYRHI